MCVICISDRGVEQPSKKLMKMMWDRNPHGAGYMFARGKYVYIRKGFMTFNAFYQAVLDENFTKDDVVVYHFRISTQAGVNPEMTQPFMFTDDIKQTTVLRTRTNIGICHNGIISITSDGDKKYSDTAKFIVEYLPAMVSKPMDLQDPSLQKEIYSLINSRMVFLDYAGNITKVGNFVSDGSGLVFSNNYFMPYDYYRYSA